MARSRTLVNLRTDVRQRANLENSTFVTDAELNEYINQSIAELYDLLVQAQGHDYYLTSYTFNTADGTTDYTLPADFYQVISVRGSIRGANITFEPWQDWHRTLLEPIPGYRGVPTSFRVRQGNITILPTPNGVYPVTMEYLPCSARLANDSDTWDGYNGWEEYAIWRAVSYCQAKERTDPGFAMAQIAKLEDRIRRLAGNRNQFGPDKIRDVEAEHPLYPWRKLPWP